MSDLRIGLVAEGKTDQIVIEAVLGAILDQPFVLTLLQPETSDPFGGAGPFGGGWPGVYRWCRQIVSMSWPIADNPSLAGFDAILLHLDADVAGMRYDEANIEDGRNDLPCERPCPPAEDSVNALREVAARWVDLRSPDVLPKKWVFCNPSKCTEAWVIVACYVDAPSAEQNILPNIECNPDLVKWLSQRPVQDRLLVRGGKRLPSGYKKIAPRVKRQWSNVVNLCSQASRFENELRSGLQAPPERLPGVDQ